MLLEDVFKYCGSWANVCRILDFGSTTYQKWKQKGYIPYTTQLLIEKKTNGKLRASLDHAKPNHST